nr:YdeI/OmpD-associated family protein [Pseudonocardia sp. C8]
MDAHAATATEAWLVLPLARSGRPGLTHRQALEEALCVGWIDGLNQRHDDTSRRQRFTPRSPRSAWSTVNRELVATLTAQGRMAPAGLAAVERAKADGRWLLLADAQAGIVPDDLQAALDADPAAAAAWERRRPSERRMILEGLARAVRADTRARRIRAACGRP